MSIAIPVVKHRLISAVTAFLFAVVTMCAVGACPAMAQTYPEQEGSAGQFASIEEESLLVGNHEEPTIAAKDGKDSISEEIPVANESDSSPASWGDNEAQDSETGGDAGSGLATEDRSLVSDKSEPSSASQLHDKATGLATAANSAKSNAISWDNESVRFSVLTEDGVLVLYNREASAIPSIGEKEPWSGGIVAQVWTDDYAGLTEGGLGPIPWSGYKSQILRVVAADVVSPVWTASWFMDCVNLKVVDDFDFHNLDLSKVEYASFMFSGCTSLVSFDVPDADFSSCKVFRKMFADCRSLVTVNLGKRNADALQNPAYSDMFSGCTSLENLSLLGWQSGGDLMYLTTSPNLSRLTLGGGVHLDYGVQLPFNSYGWRAVDARGTSYGPYTTWQALCAHDMMRGVDSVVYENYEVGPYYVLTDDGTLLLYAGESKGIPKVGDEVAERKGSFVARVGRCNFEEQSNVIPWEGFRNEIIEVVALETFQPTRLSFWFKNCPNLKSIDLNKLDTSRITEAIEAFAYCSSLVDVRIDKWNTPLLERIGSMFRQSSSLVELSLENWDTSAARDTLTVFEGCDSLSVLHLGPKARFYGDSVHLPFNAHGWSTSPYGTSAASAYKTPQEFAAAERVRTSRIDYYNFQFAEDPVVNSQLLYNGSEQTGVYASPNHEFTLAGTASAVRVGAYRVLATLSEGYRWYDPAQYLKPITLEPRLITWTIVSEIVEHFAVYSEDDHALVLYNRVGAPKEGDYFDGRKVTKLFGDYVNATAPSWCWSEGRLVKNECTSVRVADDIEPQSMAGWFQDFIALETCDLSKVHVFATTNMAFLFSECKSLMSVKGISDWDVAALQNAMGLFRNCSRLTSLDLSSWNVMDSTVLTNMYLGCDSLESLVFGSKGILSTDCALPFGGYGWKCDDVSFASLVDMVLHEKNRSDESATYVRALPQIAQNPVAKQGLVYSGDRLTAVVPGEGYTLSGDASGINAGAYQAIATLDHGWIWQDGSNDPCVLEWTIDKAVLTARYISEEIEAGKAPALIVDVIGFVGNESAETAALYQAPIVLADGIDLNTKGKHELDPQGGNALNYVFDYVSGILTIAAPVVPVPAVEGETSVEAEGVLSGDAIESLNDDIRLIVTANGGEERATIEQMAEGSVSLCVDAMLLVNGVAVHDGFGSFNLVLPVDRALNGESVTVWHLHHGGYLTSERVQVVDGVVTVGVSDLSTFAVEVAKPDDPTPGPIDPADPADPTDPTDPVDPVCPVDPADPVDPAGPTDSSDPFPGPADPDSRDEGGSEGSADSRHGQDLNLAMRHSKQGVTPATGDSMRFATSWLLLVLSGVLVAFAMRRKQIA